MNKKIKIFECYRTLIYAPLYHVVNFKNQYSLENIDFEFGLNTQGDLGALNGMAAEPSNIHCFPVAICDPFVNLNNGGLHNPTLRIVSTMIDRIAIWVVAFSYKNPNSKFQSNHNKLLNQLKNSDLSSFITDVSSNNKIICYPSEAYSTSSIFNHFFEIAGLPTANRKNDLELTTAREEKDLLLQDSKYLLMTNNPWAIDDLIRMDTSTKQYQLDIIRDFGPMLVPFTGIITKKESLELPVKNNPIDDFIHAVGIACLKIYKDPDLIINDLISLGHDYFNIKVTGRYFREIIENSINHIVHRRIYNINALTSYYAWDSFGNDILSHEKSFLLNTYKTYTENYLAEKHICKSHLLID